MTDLAATGKAVRLELATVTRRLAVLQRRLAALRDAEAALVRMRDADAELAELDREAGRRRQAEWVEQVRSRLGLVTIDGGLPDGWQP